MILTKIVGLFHCIISFQNQITQFQFFFSFKSLEYPRIVFTFIYMNLFSLQIRVIAIIAEGIPENMTRKLILKANAKGVSIIGPATVGGIKPGCLKIGNTGGMMDNILHSKLYRPGR